MTDEREQQIRERLETIAQPVPWTPGSWPDDMAYLLDALAAAREREKEKGELLAEWIDDEAMGECRPGRHGDCEVHLYAGPCIVGRTRAALAREDGDAD